MMKSIVLIIMVGLLMVPLITVANTSLNDVVKEARRTGQVLSAKTRDGVHEVRVMTPQGTIRTVRKSAGRVVAQPDARQQPPEAYNNPYLQRPSRYQAEPQKEPQSNRQEPRQSSRQTQRPQSRPPQPRRSQPPPASRQPRDRQPEPKDPD